MSRNVTTFFLNFLFAFLFSVNLNAEVQGVESVRVLRSEFKLDAQRFFQENYAEDERFKVWFESFQNEVGQMVNVHKEREASREKANKDLRKLHDTLEKISPRIEEVVAKFDEYPWQKSLIEIESILKENQVYWSDFSFYSKPLKKFIDETILHEKAFWKKRAQSIVLNKKALPVAEGEESLVPDEALTKRLKALGFLSKFFDFSKVSVSLSHRSKVALLQAIVNENAFLTYVSITGQ
jgi:hypothetical protein